MTKNSKVLISIIGAATAGIAIGLLLSPEKGKDMRKKVKKSADKFADSLNHVFISAKKKLSKNDLKQKAENMS